MHFLKIARGSLCELETQINTAKELGFVTNGIFIELEQIIIEESKMLNAFIKSLNK